MSEEFETEGHPARPQKARKPDTVLEAQRSADDLAWVLADPRGRRVMWRLLLASGMDQTSFTGNSQTFFNEGRRNLGLEIKAEIIRCGGLQAFHTIELENRNV